MTKPITDSAAARMATEAVPLLAFVRPAVESDLFKRMRDCRPGQPVAARYDRASRPGPKTPPREEWPGGENPVRDQHLPPDPVGEAAIMADRSAEKLEAEFKTAMAQVYALLRRCADIAEAWMPHEASPLDQARTDGDPGCWSCHRHRRTVEKDGKKVQLPTWSPIYRERVHCADGDRHDLCSWCWRWQIDTHRLPTPTELRHHHDPASDSKKHLEDARRKAAEQARKGTAPVPAGA